METANTTVEQCDFSKQEHRNAYLTLLNRYMVNPMGGMDKGLDENQQKKLIEQLTANPMNHCFLLRSNGKYVGFSTCFFITSTFKVKPYLYIHDIYVEEDCENKGLGTQLLNGLIDFARKSGCCKVTLEVRYDNEIAKHVYSKQGFVDCEPPMYFWTKLL